MLNRNAFQKLAKTRLKEAKILFDNNYYDGCCYLSGYVIEYAFKARICRILDVENYENDFTGDFRRAYHTHDFKNLLLVSRLKKLHENMTASSPIFRRNWDFLINNWSENIRYLPIGTNPASQAQKIIEAVDDKQNGVFSWIKKYW